MIVERPDSPNCMLELIRMLTKSKVAYERAYDRTRNQGLHDLYGALASTHAPMILDLERELAHFEMIGPGFNPRMADRLVGMLKVIREPGWLLGEDGILRIAHRTESGLLATYERHLLKPDLPARLRNLLTDHRVQLLANVKNIGLFSDNKASFA